jgi:glycosyltransferase involved in cell wall biosynthesis
MRTSALERVKRTWVVRRLNRLRYKVRQVRPTTLASLSLKNALSRKIKVGFGPIRTGETDLNVRKWRIDPIVNHINGNSSEYVADFFFEGDDLERFEIIVLVKVYSDDLVAQLGRLKRRVIVFDVVDNPLGCKRSIYDDNELARSLSGLILSSPTQAPALAKYALPLKLIEHPILNTSWKTDYGDSDPVTLVWQGFRHNAGGTEHLEELIRGLGSETGRRIKLVYHTNAAAADDGFVQVVPWTVDNAFSVLTAADIAISARDETRPWQKEKPSTKMIIFMAAGLPIVCAPTAAERLVIQSGVTGYFATSPDEWKQHLSRLILDPRLREKMGRAGRQYAVDNFSVARIARKYVEFFDELRACTQGPAVVGVQTAKLRSMDTPLG